MKTKISVYTDGATLGQNKIGVTEFVGLGVYFPHLGRGMCKKVEGISNNEAELKALHYAMKLCVQNNFTDVEFFCDSWITVNRACGNKPKMRKYQNDRMDALQDNILNESKNFKSCTFKWVPREMNKEADYWSKKALVD